MTQTTPLDRLLGFATKMPDHIAVEDANGPVSYGEFGRMVARMAGAIADTASSAKVFIHLPQGAPAYAAMFATHMAGGFYTPCNVAHPRNRKMGILAQFAPDVIIGDGTTRSDLAIAEGSRHIDVTDLTASPLGAARRRHDLAYVMFTSGSTGQPKGVMIPHEALDHYVAWALEALAVRPEDRWSQHPNIGFDLSVLDIYGALAGGATLVPLAGRRDRLLPADAIRRRRLTIWNSVPSVVDLMAKAKQLTPAHLASLRVMTFCGEPLLPSHLARIFAARPDLAVHNTYGPTEATVSVTSLWLNAETYQEACGASVALGDAIPGMGLHLIDGETRNEGEVVLTGPQLARGYWNAPEETARQFQTLKIGGKTIAAYRTGDRARRRNGHVFFENRIDRQIKLHGHRIELGEIDTALRHAGAIAACTILSDNKLVSFVEIVGDVSAAGLLDEIRNSLPGYAIPATVVPIDRLPRSANDKIDVNTLARDAQLVSDTSSSNSSG